MNNSPEFGRKYAFDAEKIVAEYELGRPRYPHQSAKWIFETHAASAGSPQKNLIVSEAGIGTGLFTSRLVEAANDSPGLIEKIHAYEPADKMRAAAKSIRAFAEPLSNGFLTINDGTFHATGLKDKSIDVQIAAQSLHWGTRDEENCQKTIAETLRILKNNGSVFAIYNAPVAHTADSFTSVLNQILAEKCPEPYYQTMASGDWERFLGPESKSNLGKFFNAVAEQGKGRVVQTTIMNPSSYHNAALIKSYVFSNAFVQKALQEKSGLEAELNQDIDTIFARHNGKNGLPGLFYGNTTFVIGAVGIQADSPAATPG